jgi:hypothetical protein
VQVISCASAVWAPEDEFDWNKLVVVLPDMHLMTGPHGSPWHSRFVLDPELDLLDFAKRICDIDELEGKLQIIHIGDSYDLWVGCEPRYYKAGRPSVHDNLELVQPGPGTWSCKASDCPGDHPTPDKKCDPGVWHCGRRRRTPSAIVQAVSPVTRLVPKEDWYVPFCFGHPNPDETCDTGEDYTWDCGRVSEGFVSLNGSSCSREHKSRAETCAGSGNNFWRCGKTSPPCPGHTDRSHRCPETVDPIDELVHWIRDIQGIENTENERAGEDSNWVAHLLKMRIAEGQYPAGVDIDNWEHELVADLQTSEGGDVRWINPAVKALRTLSNNCGGIVYIYGNHDDYLILKEVSDQARISKRDRYWETSGVLIEHGHRLEALLTGINSKVPRNFDGEVSGYTATNTAYKQKLEAMDTGLPGKDWLERIRTHIWDKWNEEPVNWADLRKVDYKKVKWTEEDWVIVGSNKWAQWTQQTQYQTEFAKLWVGRRAYQTYPPPHIFVIGHTHMPMLSYVNIALEDMYLKPKPRPKPNEPPAAKAAAQAGDSGDSQPHPAPGPTPGPTPEPE